MTSTLLAETVVVLLLTTTAASAAPAGVDRQSLDAGGRAYDCRPAPDDMPTPPPDPKFDAETAKLVAEQKAKLAADPDCPAGDVVVPFVYDEPKAGPPPAKQTPTGATGMTGAAAATIRSTSRAPGGLLSFGAESTSFG